MMVTGQVPFGKIGPLDCWMKKIRNDYIPPRELNPSISDRVDWAIRRAMSGDPEQRPSSCREFIEDVTGVTIRQPSAFPEQTAPATDVWYLVYKDDTGESHTVKGTTDGIRRALKEQLLGDASNIRACRSKAGPFQSLKTFTEFRDMVVEPAPMPTAPPAVASGNFRSAPINQKSATSGKWNRASGMSARAKIDTETVDLNQPPRAGSKERPGGYLLPNANNPHSSAQRPHIKIAQENNLGNAFKTFLLVLVVASITAALAALLLPKIM
jgi:hypothetical protein